MSDDYKEFLELLNCHKVNYVIVEKKRDATLGKDIKCLYSAIRR